MIDYRMNHQVEIDRENADWKQEAEVGDAGTPLKFEEGVRASEIQRSEEER